MKKIELLAPAGDLEKLKIAVVYGADAVYFGGEMFSLRAGAGNMTLEEMKEGVEFAHARGVKCYLTVNIFAHNEDIQPLTDYLTQLRDIHMDLDAYIVSDPGIIDLIQEIIPEAEIHLSTQANMTNFRTANFWYKFGVKRIVLARELTFEEIRQLRQQIPEDMELEAFVHGAMCISYSGRCLLSNFMIERDANRRLRPLMPVEILAGGRTAAGRILSCGGRRKRNLYPQFQRSLHDRTYSGTGRSRHRIC